MEDEKKMIKLVSSSNAIEGASNQSQRICPHPHILNNESGMTRLISSGLIKRLAFKRPWKLFHYSVLLFM